MDEDQIYIQVQKCKHLKFKFRGVYAADNYPLKLPVNSFIIVNASRAESIGTHWVILAKRIPSTILCRSVSTTSNSLQGYFLPLAAMY